MRTTIRIQDELLREAKKVAAESGRSLTAVIEEALRGMLLRRRSPRKRKRIRLVTVDGQGLQPGVDLDDTSSLLDLMDGHRDPA